MSVLPLDKKIIILSLSFKVNGGTVGFYRVMYPGDMVAQLLPAIQDLSLTPKDRLGLQSDLFALVGYLIFISVDLYVEF